MSFPQYKKQFVCLKKISREELRKAVINTIASLDRPMGPGSKGVTAMVREFCGLTDEQRNHFRDRVFEITPELLQEPVAAHLCPNMAASAIAVYASEDRLKKANELLENKVQIEPLIQL